MEPPAKAARASRNVALYPWFKFCQNLVFWQATWFLYFQNELSAAEAILLYAVYDVATTALELPSGYMSDRIGRRVTLIGAAFAGLAGMVLLTIGGGLTIFVLAQIVLGASAAFSSGTDSAMLYESLNAADRRAELERQELKAWRFSFCALAVSAVIGGLMARNAPTLPFFASGIAFAVLCGIALRFREPPDSGAEMGEGTELARLHSLGAAFRQPVLVWIFALSVLMYAYSHIPFVFGQPFMLNALGEIGFGGETPLVSGVVTALMMVLSVLTSLIAPGMRRRWGLAVLLLGAFALQIALSGVLALSNELWVIGVLFLRMVPDSLSRPFILARIQPLLQDGSRATYLSLQSFCGRLLFAATLVLASTSASDAGEMAYGEIQSILDWYVIAGVGCLAALAIGAARVRIDGPTEAR